LSDGTAILSTGGPATAKNEWIEEFRDFCERNKMPLDFITKDMAVALSLGNFSSGLE